MGGKLMIVQTPNGKAPRVTRGFINTKRRLRNISMLIRTQPECNRTLVSSDPRRARESNPSGCKTTRRFADAVQYPLAIPS